MDSGCKKPSVLPQIIGLTDLQQGCISAVVVAIFRVFCTGKYDFFFEEYPIGVPFEHVLNLQGIFLRQDKQMACSNAGGP